MNYKQLAKHFGNNKSEMARVLECTRGAIRYWELTGHIPLLRQELIEMKTNGKLKADTK